MMGPQRRTLTTPEENRKTAIHEGGHALVGLLTEGADYVHKATIIPRGGALGYVLTLPNSETSKTKKEYLAQLDLCMGGRVAEEVVLGADNISSGAMNDLQSATNIARSLVTNFGMGGETAGWTSYDERTWGKLSDDSRKLADSEVDKLLRASYERVRTLMTANKQKLLCISNALVERETLGHEELAALRDGRKMPPRANAAPAASSSGGILGGLFGGFSGAGASSSPVTSPKA